MAKKMLIDATHPEETRVVVADGNKVDDFDFESISKKQIAGNIYLAKVTRVEPSLQAAFVEYGGNRHGFLAFSEIHPDYYQIPRADREALMAEEEAEARKRAASEDGGRGRRKGRTARRAVEEVEDDQDAGDQDEDDDDDLIGDDESMKVDSIGGDDDTDESDDDTSSDDAQPEPEAPKAEAEPEVVAAPEASESSAPEASDPDIEEVDPNAKPPSSIAESAGTGDDDRIEEDYAPERKPEEEDASAASEPAPVAEPETPAEPVATTVTEDAPVEPAAETSTETVTEVTEETAPEATLEATAEIAAKSPEDAAATTGDDEGSDDESDDNADGEESDEDGDRRRRRSRRGGRSRRSRRGRTRGDEGEAEPEAEAEQPRRASRSRSSRNDDDDDAPAPAAESAGRDDDDDAEMAEISARRIFQRRYKIQEVIKVRQILLVQVVKEERGNKGAALTTYLSLAGRYCVLMPNTARGGGISRKITNAADRKKLKDIASEFEVPKGMGLIIRTAGAKRTRAEIERDYEYLLRQWEQVRSITLQSVAPSLIYEEGSLIKRVIRDLYATGIDQIVVAGEEGWREARDYMGMLMPGHVRNVVLHEAGAPLFAKHGVEAELSALIHPVVQLKSGGYIVVGITEALVAIDINSGKSTKEGSIEDTALKTNLEAADEIARQLRLRDLAGLIVIDFIDMEDPRNNRAVEKRMKEKLKIDRARIQVGRISAFGLMEMSRQRLRPGVLEATTSPCAHCHGTGIVRADSSLALTILRQLEGEASRARAPELLVHAPMGAAAYLLNDKREHLTQIEAQYGVVVRVQPDPALFSPEFHIEKVKTQTRRPVQVAAVTALSVAPPDLEEYDQVEEAELVEAPSAPEPEAAVEPAPAPRARAAEETPEDEDDASRRRRGRRGGRRRRRGGKDDEAEGDDARQTTDADAGDAPEAEAETEPKAAEPEAAQPEVDAAIPAPRRTRRRRKPRGDEAEAPVEAADAEPDVEPAAEAPEPEARPEPEVIEAAAAELTAEAPEEAPEPAPQVVEPEPVAVAEAPAGPTPEPALEARPEPVEAMVETAPEPAAEDDDRPKKRGWWAFNR